jgi:hypothetical protein
VLSAHAPRGFRKMAYCADPRWVWVIYLDNGPKTKPAWSTCMCVEDLFRICCLRQKLGGRKELEGTGENCEVKTIGVWKGSELDGGSG